MEGTNLLPAHLFLNPAFCFILPRSSFNHFQQHYIPQPQYHFLHYSQSALPEPNLQPLNHLPKAMRVPTSSPFPTRFRAQSLPRPRISATTPFTQHNSPLPSPTSLHAQLSLSRPPQPLFPPRQPPFPQESQVQILSYHSNFAPYEPIDAISSDRERSEEGDDFFPALDEMFTHLRWGIPWYMFLFAAWMEGKGSLALSSVWAFIIGEGLE